MGISYITNEFAKDELENELLFKIPIKEKFPKRNLGIILLKFCYREVYWNNYGRNVLSL